MNAKTDDITLPELPKPWDLQHDDVGKPQVLYTAEQMRAYAISVLADRAERAVPEGYALVPLEPPDESIAAACKIVDLTQSDPEDHRYDDGTECAKAIYRAMVAVALRAQAAQPTVQAGAHADAMRALVRSNDKLLRQVRTQMGIADDAAPSAPQEAQREPWVTYLSDRADGVKGHYAIARWNPAGYREVWNLRRHEWNAFSDEVLTLEQAQALLRDVVIPSHPAQPSAQPGQEAVWTPELLKRLEEVTESFGLPSAFPPSQPGQDAERLMEAIGDALHVLGTGECKLCKCEGCSVERKEAIGILNTARAAQAQEKGPHHG